MKLWIKYLLALAVGYLYIAFIPYFSDQIEWVHTITRVFSLALPWVLYPLVFFTASSASAFVKRQRQFARLLKWSLLWSAATHLLLVLMAGVIAYQVAAPTVLPQFASAAPEFSPLNSLTAALQLSHLPMWLVLASGLIIGLALQPGDERYIQGYQAVNSFGEVFFRISRCASELLTLGIIAFSSAVVLQHREISLLSQEYVLLLVVLLSSLIAVLLMLPLITMILCSRRHPYRWLLSLAAPYLAAGVSGKYLLGVLPLYGHTRTNVGAAKSVSSLTIPWYMIAGRGGTAMVTAVISVSVITGYGGEANPMLLAAAAGGLSIAVSFLAVFVPGFELPFSVLLVLSAFQIPAEILAGTAAVSLLLQGAAASVDIMISGMGTGYTAQKLDAELETSWKDMQ